MERMLVTDNINEVKGFYGRKYRAILNSLEKLNASNFEIDTYWGDNIRLECIIQGRRMRVLKEKASEFLVQYNLLDSHLCDFSEVAFNIKEVCYMIEQAIRWKNIVYKNELKIK